MLGKITSQTSDLSVSRVQDIFLGVQLSVQISILLLSINEKTLLVINFLSEGGDHINVDLNSALVVVLHSSLLVSNSVEVLLQGKKLILEQFVFSLSLSQFHGFGSQLGNEPVFVVLSDGSVCEFSLWASGHSW